MEKTSILPKPMNELLAESLEKNRGKIVTEKDGLELPEDLTEEEIHRIIKLNTIEK